MRILMCVHGYPPECRGGTESYLSRLTGALSREGHEVAVVSGSFEGGEETRFTETRHEGVVVYRVQRRSLYSDHWSKSYAPDVELILDRIAAEFRPDLVHVHHWIRLTRSIVSWAHSRGTPAVLTLHDLWSTCPLAFRVREDGFCQRAAGGEHCIDCAPVWADFSRDETRRALVSFIDDHREEIRLARRVIVPTRAHGAELLTHHGELGARFEVIPFASVTDLKRSRPLARGGDDGVHFVHFGHLSRFKGTDVLLRAVALVPEAVRSRMRVAVFGAIVYPQERELIADLAARAGVELKGEYAFSELAEHDADIAVFPSRCAETHSVVLDEAFALGWPAIVPDRGALGERLGAAGIRFRPEDPASLSECLQLCVANPGLIEGWRSAIPAPIPFAEHVDRTLEVYRQVLADPRPLPQASPDFSSRRNATLSLHLEARLRQIEHLRGEVRNLREDVARQESTLREMDHYHREKDKLIAHLESRIRDQA